MKKLTITFVVLDILVAICFFVVYASPFHNFQNTIITTALTTKSHGYIANIFWSEDRISKSLAQTSYIPLTDSVDLDAIVIDTEEKDEYDNEYDEAILTRDEGNENYKYLKIKVGNNNAHLVAIYDPAKIKLMACARFNTSTKKAGKETILEMNSRLGAVIGINAGGFYEDGKGLSTDVPLGYVIKNSKVIWSENNDKANLIGFTKDNKLILTSATGTEAVDMGIRDAIQFGPFIIVNGETIKQTNVNAGGFPRAARVAIAQRRDGIVLFLVTEGSHASGPTIKEVADTLALYGAYNAANLDGGSSAQLVIKNKLINEPKNIDNDNINGGRNVVTGFGLFL